MNTDPITCPSCNAADRSTADAHGVHVCEYCGIRYRLRHGEPQALATASTSASPWRSPQVLVAVMAAVGLGVVIGRSTTEPPAPHVPAEPTPAPAPTPTTASPLDSLDPLVAPFYTPPPPTAAEAARAEFVHDGTRPGYRGALYVLGRVTNTSMFPIQSAAVTVVLLDEHDREVAVDKGYPPAPVIEPGATTPISIMLSHPPAHVRMAFEVEARAADSTKRLPAVRIVDPIAEPPREGKRWGFRGRIANDGDVPLRFARVSIFGISADGKTLGELATYANVEILDPGQSARWVAQGDDFLGPPARFEYVVQADFVQ